MSINLQGSHLEKPSISSWDVAAAQIPQKPLYLAYKDHRFCFFLNPRLSYFVHIILITSLGFKGVLMVPQIKVTLPRGFTTIKTIQEDGHLSWRRRDERVLNPSNTCLFWIDQHLSGHVYSGMFIWVKHQSLFFSCCVSLLTNVSLVTTCAFYRDYAVLDMLWYSIFFWMETEIMARQVTDQDYFFIPPTLSISFSFT